MLTCNTFQNESFGSKFSRLFRKKKSEEAGRKKAKKMVKHAIKAFEYANAIAESD